MKIFKTIILIILIAVIVIFTVQNMEMVKLGFLNLYLEIPLSILSVSIYVLGAISGGLVLSMLKKLTHEATENENK